MVMTSASGVGGAQCCSEHLAVNTEQIWTSISDLIVSMIATVMMSEQPKGNQKEIEPRRMTE